MVVYVLAHIILIVMPNFKTFISERLTYIVSHFKNKAVLLNFDGTPSAEIDLSFNQLSDEFLNMEQQQQDHGPVDIQQGLGSLLRITDQDLDEFLNTLNPQWKGRLNIADQNITDHSLLRLCTLLKHDKCKLTGLDLTNNKAITHIGALSLGQALQTNSYVIKLILKGLKLNTDGANRIIELVNLNKNIIEYDFGIIGNQSLKYLAKQLENPHCVNHFSFGEDVNDRWKADGKKALDQALRKNSANKQISSITLYPDDSEEHISFMAELSIFCTKNRKEKIKERENDFKSKSLNPEHPKYYDPDNHSLNAYKFSVKSYLNNVFESMLDEGLYFLEKQRRNSLREEAIFNVTKIPVNKTILEDICTADGSIMVLAQYLLKKIKP